MRLPSVSLALTLIAAFIAIPNAFSQGSPVKFTSPELVQNVDAINEGAIKAVAGVFTTDKRLDIEFYGATDELEQQENYANIALNQGGGRFNVIDANVGDFSDAEPGADLAVDLNGDGISDLISWHFNPGLIIQFGKGDGTFIGGETIQVDASNSAVVDAVAADFDGNGTMDLAVLTAANKLVIFLNDGHGNLHAAFTYSTTGGRIAAGDINGDKLPDVVLVNSGTVTPYLSTHGGALVKGTTFSLPTANPNASPVIADINNDGHGDVAVPTSTGVKFLLGSSGGELTSGSSITVPGDVAIVLADFNKDGKKDLAVAGMQLGASYVNVYFGKGNGTFNSPSVYGTGNIPVSLLAGNFYGAGNVDLATFGKGIAGLTVLQNLGNGYFEAALVTHSSAATGIVSGDFNRDGKKDVAVVNTPSCKAPCSGSVSVFPGSGSTWFNPGKTYPIAMHGAAIAAGDLNGDGILDLVVVNAIPGDSADTSVLLGKSDGTFQPAHNYKLGSLSNDVVLADMNHDGKLDLITDGGVALGKGDGTFSARIPFPNGFVFDPSMHFAVDDVNGDGKLDVVAATDGCPLFMQVLLGDGKGGFTLGNVIDDNDEDGPVTSIALGRLRPGGPLDVVDFSNTPCNFSGTSPESFSFVNGFAGDGHGGFPTSFKVASNETFGGDPNLNGPVVLADFNGDGKLDVGVGGFGYFAVVRGNGDDTFQPLQFFTADSGPQALFSPSSNTPTLVPGGVAVADFNRDGKPDAVLTSGLGVARLYNMTTK